MSICPAAGVTLALHPLCIMPFRTPRAALGVRQRPVDRVGDSSTASQAARQHLELNWREACGRSRSESVVRGKNVGNKRSKSRRRKGCALQERAQARSASLAPVVSKQHPADRFLDRLEAREQEGAAPGRILPCIKKRLTQAEDNALFALIRLCTSQGIDYQGTAAAATDPDAQLPAEQSVHRPVETHTLACRARRAHQILFAYNIRLVYYIANRYLNQQIEQCDLISAGLAGLNTAIQKFDPGRSTAKFSSVAFLYIQRDVSICAMQQKHVVSLPVSVQRRQNQVQRLKDTLKERDGIDIDNPLHRKEALTTLAEELGVTERTVLSDLKSMQRRTVSMDELVYGGDGGHAAVAWVDVLASDDAVEREEKEKASELQEALEAVLLTLEPRERNIVRLRKGLNSNSKVVPLSQIAAAYGLSETRIQQIEVAAIRKLGAPWRLQILERMNAFRR